MDQADQAIVEQVLKRLEEKYSAELTSLKELLAIPNLIPALSISRGFLYTIQKSS